MKRVLVLLISVLLLSSCLGPNVGDYRVKLLSVEEIQLDEVEKWAVQQAGSDAAMLFVGDRNYEVFVQLSDSSVFSRLDVDAISLQHEAELLQIEIESADLHQDTPSELRVMHITSRSVPAPKAMRVIIDGTPIPLTLERYE